MNLGKICNNIDMEEILEKSQASRYQHWLLSGSILLLLIAGAIYFLIDSSDGATDRTLNADGSKNLGLIQPTNLNQYRREGNFEAALQELERIQSSPLKDVDEQALAIIGSANIKFSMTGDTKDILEKIDNLKKVVIDPAVDLRVRVDALNMLSASFCRSGRDPLVFAELFKDEPFRSYLAPGDPDLSARNMAEWSYGQRPTSFAAIRITRWYSEQMLENTDPSSKTRAQYVEETKKYLQSADKLAESELSRIPTLSQSTPYIAYKMWRTVAIGRLAAVDGEPYKSQYKDEFEGLFSFLDGLNNVETREYEYLGRHFYADLLLRIDSDTPAAKEQLSILARKLRALPNPDVVTYVRFLRNESRSNPNGYLWRSVKNMMSASSDYKVTVEKFLATTPQ